jgi:serine/threonine protein kinase
MIGKTIRTTAGRELTIMRFIDRGGQGTAYEAWASDGQSYVVKTMAQGLQSDATRQRIERLVGLRLSLSSPALAAPDDWLQSPLLGHVSPLVGARSLEELLSDPGEGYGLQTALLLSIQLCMALSELEKRGIAHGDLSATNVRIHDESGVPALSLIDFDNANLGPGSPPPPSVGQVLYMAPELRIPLERRQPVPPATGLSDRFALMALLHEILLLRPVAMAEDAGDFFTAMVADRYPQDPQRRRRDRPDNGGLPAEVLDAATYALFRRTFAAATPAERPSADEWLEVLVSGFSARVFACDRCDGQVLVEAGKHQCPYCKEEYPRLALRTGSTTIALSGASMVVGRSLLGGTDVSSKHAVIRRIGPETFLTDRSSNGTYRFGAARWQRLEEGRAHLIEAGDRLRFGSLEVWVESVA